MTIDPPIHHAHTNCLRVPIVILRRYMTRQVASTTALVLGFLVVMMLGGRLIRYFGIAAEGRLDIGLLFTIIGYNLPYFLELILPLAFFIALMLVFGRLYVDQEMAVINASGVSRGRLARLMTPLILALFVGEAALSIVGKPWGVRSSEAVWQQQALTSAFDLISPNEFISSDNYHLYVGSLSDDKKKLQDVILIQSEPTPKGNAGKSADMN
ncbi:LptF/LptG family permease, partial [uncultured Psychrobacter sp.]